MDASNHVYMALPTFLFCRWNSCSHVKRRCATSLRFKSYDTQCHSEYFQTCRLTPKSRYIVIPLILGLLTFSVRQSALYLYQTSKSLFLEHLNQFCFQHTIVATSLNKKSHCFSYKLFKNKIIINSIKRFLLFDEIYTLNFKLAYSTFLEMPYIS